MSKTISNVGGLWNNVATWVEGIIPTNADDVIATPTSGPLTIEGTPVCRSFNMDTYNNTITHNAGVDLVIGDSVVGAGSIGLKFSTTTIYNPLDNYTSRIQFNSSNVAEQTIDYGTQETGDVNYINGTWKLLSNHTGKVGMEVILTNGLLDTNDFEMNWGYFLTSNSNARTIKFGASIINLYGGPDIRTAGNINEYWDSTTSTNLTVIANTCTVNIYKFDLVTDAPLFRSGSKDWNGMNLVFHGGGISTISGGTFIWNSLIVNGDLFNGVEDRFQINISFTVLSNLEFNGASSSKRLRVHSNSGTRLLTMTGASVSTQYSNFSYIKFSEIVDLSNDLGGAGDLGSNQNIIFTPGITAYWFTSVSGTYNWGDTANWFQNTGGVGVLYNGILPQDSLILDENSVGDINTIIEVTASGIGVDISWVGVQNNPTWHFITDGTMYGSLYLDPNMTITVEYDYIWLWVRGNGTGNTFDFSTAGVYMPMQLILFYGVDSTNTISIQSDLYAENIYIREIIVQTNIYDMYLNSMYQRVNSILNMGSGVWRIRGEQNNFGSSAWRNREGVVVPETSTVIMINEEGTTQTFEGVNNSFYNLAFEGAVGSVFIVKNSNSFNFLYSINDVAYTVKFTAGTTNTFNRFDLRGSVGNEITLDSTSTSVFNLVSNGTPMYSSYLNISNSNVSGSQWAGANSTDVTNNTGWLFTARILYHKGGIISDPANWSLTNNGAGGEPIPTVLDKAIFPSSSTIDPDFDIDFYIGDFEYQTNKWANGVGLIEVMNEYIVSGNPIWFMHNSLTLHGDITLSNSSHGLSMPVFIVGYDSIITGQDNGNKATSNFTNIDKYISKTLKLGSDTYFTKGTGTDTILDGGIIDHYIYNITIGQYFIQNGGEVVGVIGKFNSQRYILSKGKFDPFEAESNTTADTIIFQDGLGMDLMPSGGRFTFSGSNHWSLSQTYTEFAHVRMNKCPTCSQSGAIYIRDRLEVINGSKFGSFFLRGNIDGVGDSTGNSTFLGENNQVSDFVGHLNNLVFNKPIGTVTFNNDIKVKGINAIQGGDRVDFGTSLVDINATSSHLTLWSVVGLVFYDLKLHIASTGSGAMSGTTNIARDFIISQTQTITGSAINVGRNLIVLDTTVGGGYNASTTNSINMVGNTPQVITMPPSASFALKINILNIVDVVSLGSLINNTSSFGSLFVEAGAKLNLNGYNVTINGKLQVKAGGKLQVKGDEIVTIDGNPSRGNVDFVLDPNSTVEYVDNSIIAIVDTLSDVFENLTFGENKVHEFNSGVGNEIEVKGILDSNSSLGSWAILRTVNDVAAEWFIKLTGTSNLTNNVSVKYSNASSGNQINALGSLDEGNTTNWFGLLSPNGFNWIGHIDDNFENATNWFAGVVPGVAAIAIFNAISANPCKMTVDIDVLGIAADGYLGVISQESGTEVVIGLGGYSQDGGTFSGGDSDIIINGLITCSGGDFNSTTGLLIMFGGGDFTGGNFINNGGSVRLPTASNKTIKLYNISDLNNFKLDGSQTASAHGYWDIVGDITINGLFEFLPFGAGGWASKFLNLNTFNINGDCIGNDKYFSRDVIINILQSGVQTFTNFSIGYGEFNLNKPNDKLIIVNKISFGNDSTTQNILNLNLNSELDALTNQAMMYMSIYRYITINLNGSILPEIFDLKVNGYGTGHGKFELQGKEIDVYGDLTGYLSVTGWVRQINNGQINVYGNLDFSIPTSRIESKGTALIKMVGVDVNTIRNDSASYFNDVQICKTGLGEISILDQFSNRASSFIVTEGKYNNDGGGALRCNNFILQDTTVDAHVNKITCDGMFVQDGGNFLGDGAKHSANDWFINGGLHSVSEIDWNGSDYYVNIAASFLVAVGGVLYANNQQLTNANLSLNGNAIRGFKFDRAGFNLNFDSMSEIKGDCNFDGGGFVTSTTSLEVKIGGKILSYDLNYTQLNNLTFYFADVLNQEINYTNLDSNPNRGFPSIKIDNTDRDMNIKTTRPDKQIAFARDFINNIGEKCITQADCRLVFQSEQEPIYFSEKIEDKIHFNKGEWLLHFLSNVTVNELTIKPKAIGVASSTNDGSGSNIEIHKSYVVESDTSPDVIITADTPDVIMVGDEVTIEALGPLFKLLEGNYKNNKVNNIVKQLSDIYLKGGDVANDGNWNLELIAGGWCPNTFKLTVDGLLKGLGKGELQVTDDISNIDVVTQECFYRHIYICNIPTSQQIAFAI